MKLRILSIFILGLSLLPFTFSGCGNSEAPPEEPGEMQDSATPALPADEKKTVIDDPDVAALLSAKPDAPLPPTSFDKIMAAKNQGLITEDEAMLLTLAAGYQKEDLPNSYQSETSRNRDGLQEAEDWMNLNYERLDEKTKTMLRPYYVMPDDPDSIFNRPEGKKPLLERISLIPEANAAAPTWETHEFTTAGKEFTVYYQGESGKKQALWIQAAVIKSYPRQKALLNLEPAEEIPIYVIPMSDYGLAGCRRFQGSDYLFRYIKIRACLGEKHTKAVTAHELFHHFQYTIPLFPEMGDDYKWLMEATATWVMNDVYPGYNVEHEYLSTYRDELIKNMVQTGKSHEYGSYTWFLFLEQCLNSRDIVRSSLLNARALGAKKAAVTSLDDYDALFYQYGYWNWNLFIAKLYTDTPEFPGDLLKSESWTNGYFDKEEVFKQDFSTEPLAFTYRSLVFHNKIRRVEIEFANKTKSHQARWALLKIEGEWHLEDWSELDKRTFCRDDEYENIKAIVLIFSNADTEKTYNDVMTTSTWFECMPTWKGTINLSWENQKKSTFEGIRGSTVTTCTTRGEFAATDEIKVDEDGDGRVSESIISFERKKMIRAETSSNSDSSSGSQWQEEIKTIEGNRVAGYKNISKAPRRWRLNDYPEDATGVIFNFRIGEQGKWLKTRNVNRKSTSDASEPVWERVLEGTGSLVELDGIEINNIPERGKVFEGFEQIPIYSEQYGDYIMTFEYHYEYR